MLDDTTTLCNDSRQIVDRIERPKTAGRRRRSANHGDHSWRTSDELLETSVRGIKLQEVEKSDRRDEDVNVPMKMLRNSSSSSCRDSMAAAAADSSEEFGSSTTVPAEQPTSGSHEQRVDTLMSASAMSTARERVLERYEGKWHSLWLSDDNKCFHHQNHNRHHRLRQSAKVDISASCSARSVTPFMSDSGQSHNFQLPAHYNHQQRRRTLDPITGKTAHVVVDGSAQLLK